ncbi:MAG TPA: hypothetical protein VEL31_09980 [Ktedonobacteraceae bacterium]|nr:hypothetical protein [Ktedonobacteraceae bacterium]
MVSQGIRQWYRYYGDPILPIRGTQQNGNDAGLPGLVPGYGLLHLDIPAKG